MTSVLPIVDRELRVAARRRSTYFLRFWVALATLAICLSVLKWSRNVSPAQMGQHVLNTLGIIVLTFSMLAGVFLTSDCLSEEKREGTLGLLFLTDLKAYDVVFGKLAANSLHAFFGLLAAFPIFGLTLLMGGVTGAEFTRLMLVFVVTLFSSLGIGVAVSAVSREAKHALTLTFLWLVLFAGVFPLAWWMHGFVFSRKGMNFLLWPSPGYTYLMAFDSQYRPRLGAAEFWNSMSTLFSLGLGGVILANVLLLRSWQETGERAAGKTKPSRWQILFGKPWRILRIPINDPMYWLAARDRSSALWSQRILLFLVPVWCAILMASLLVSNQMARQGAFTAAFFSLYVLHLVTKVLIATEASRRMNEDRRSGGWELLLVTPLQVMDILKGQVRALGKHFWLAMGVVSLVNIAMVAAVHLFPKLLGMTARDQFLFTEMFLGGIVALAADFYGLIWLGMWRGLTAKKHTVAVMLTIAQIMLPPVLLVFGMIVLEPSVGDKELRSCMAFWFGVGIVLSLFSGTIARHKLETYFRAAVLGSYRAETASTTGGSA